uniref:DNA-binding protein inhibitor ID-2 n=1 Tax=Catagonus wagneri TaxID=51154 RepID=A0A8C3WEB7_9CETA
MKAFSPVRSVRKNSLSDHSLGISRSKTPVDDPMSLLYDMNDCYSKLKELVPSIPPDRKVSRMEILQHVIDYILDLQVALDSHPAVVSLHRPRPGQSPASRAPLTTLNTDISILSLQVFMPPPPPLHNNSNKSTGSFKALNLFFNHFPRRTSQMDLLKNSGRKTKNGRLAQGIL